MKRSKPFTKQSPLDIKNNIYNSVQDAVKGLSLDKRFKYNTFYQELVYSEKVTVVCSGCEGGGCYECGYSGKDRRCYPQSIILNGIPIKIIAKK